MAKKGKSLFGGTGAPGGAANGPVYELFWQGSRAIGVLTVLFIVCFGIWTFVSLWVTDAKSPFELLGVRPVENCQAYINSDFVVDCSVAQCPEGCVRGESPPPDPGCTSHEDCDGNPNMEGCDDNGDCANV